jgi:hypothetical protein
MSHALKKDILEAPIRRVRDILDGDTLFAEIRIEQLEELRADCAGSAAANALLDCAIEAVIRGALGEAGMQAALASALGDVARPAMRNIDEHYQRKAGAGASRAVRTRLDAAFGLLDCLGIARELLAPPRPPSRRSIKLRQQKGIHEGPPL